MEHRNKASPFSTGQRYPSVDWRKWISLLICAVVVLVWHSTFGGAGFSWHDLFFRPWVCASKDPVQWTGCGENLECGRIQVPLDYHNLSDGRKASLSLAKYAATSPEGRLGTLFLITGGPGSSGVNFLYRTGKNVSELLDGRYDIISWDPRGVNGTLPRVECFTSQTEQDLYYAHSLQEMGLSVAQNLSDSENLAIYASQLHLEDARNEGLIKLCVDRTGEDNLKFIGTASHVRDLERLARIFTGDVPVNFWGFSYGTIVGSYFVNMFPRRVGRGTIDGVCDPVVWSHIHSIEWAKFSYEYTERVYEGFLKSCSDAGPERCSLASNSSSPATIGKKIDKLLDELYERPLPVADARRPGALTSGMVTGFLYNAMNAPRRWPFIADILSAAINGEGAPIMDFVQNDVQLNGIVPAQTNFGANAAIICLDAPPSTDAQKKAAMDTTIKETFATLDIAPHFGATWAPDACHLWPVEANERFSGPFNHTLSNDILIIGNSFDPSTPLTGAKTVHSLLANSKLVQQDSYGHCSTAAISLCTARIIRAYYLNGTLPSEDEVLCPVTEPLFPARGFEYDVSAWNTTGGESLTAEDLRLMEIAQGLGTDMEGL